MTECEELLYGFCTAFQVRPLFGFPLIGGGMRFRVLSPLTD